MPLRRSPGALALALLGMIPAISVAATLAKPRVPSSGAYLGAWVNPKGLLSRGGVNEIPQLPLFDATIGRSMAILHVYTLFDAPLSIDVLRAVDADGAIPLVDWSCADVAAVGAGRLDATIKTYAATLRAFAKPVFLRWYWEMDQNSVAHADCHGYLHAAAFVAAWKHIWTLFQAAGATNVAFVWCPSASVETSAYYPGDAYVDWIGADRYDRKALGAGGFDYLFGKFYALWQGRGKPMLVGETAAPASYQAAYISGMQQAAPTRYPAIKAILYMDFPGDYIGAPWTLQGAGVAAFKAMANTPYFLAR